MTGITKKRLVVILNAGSLAIGAAILFTTVTGPSTPESESEPIRVTMAAALVAALIAAYGYLQVWKQRQKQKGKSQRHMSLLACAGMCGCAAGSASVIIVLSFLPQELSLTISSTGIMLSSLAVLFLLGSGIAHVKM